MIPSYASRSTLRLLVVEAVVASLGFPAAAELLGDPPSISAGELTMEAIESSVAGALDRSADPCRDFYRFACGGWLDRVELPSDQSIWSRSFSVIHEQNRNLLREIVADAEARQMADPVRRQVGTVYGACMNEAAIEERGLEPLLPWLEKIATLESSGDAFVLAAQWWRLGAGPLLAMGVSPDLKDPRSQVLHLAQGGLGLPEKGYYSPDDERKEALRAAYRQYVGDVLALLGVPESAAHSRADAVLRLETRLAEISRTAAEMRDYDRLDHPADRAKLSEMAPDLPWEDFARALGHPDLEAFNVMTPEFFSDLFAILEATDLETLRDSFRVTLVTATADLLPDRVFRTTFDFYGRRLTGQQEPQPRWKRCLSATEGAVGHAVGRLYVEKAFSPRSRDVALEMIGRITDAFEESLDELRWMDESTREAAVAKKDSLSFRIGSPSEWKDYSKLELGPDHFANLVGARLLESDRQLEKIGRPFDPDEWGWNPQVVNAGYNPQRNDHTYPAGILQPPFFHEDFPAAMNFGGMGFVVGHELTHGFDDQGRKFDAAGRLTDWWTPEVADAFEERAACVRDAYSAYEVEPGIAIDGRLTLGENIGDIGGLRQAWVAFQNWKAEQEGEVPGLAGLTADQLFYVSAAQVWCAEVAPEYERMQVQSDPHSPARFRVLGTMAHQPGFAEAFSCPSDAPMVPEEPCRVW